MTPRQYHAEVQRLQELRRGSRAQPHRNRARYYRPDPAPWLSEVGDVVPDEDDGSGAVTTVTAPVPAP